MWCRVEEILSSVRAKSDEEFDVEAEEKDADWGAKFAAGVGAAVAASFCASAVSED